MGRASLYFPYNIYFIKIALLYYKKKCYYLCHSSLFTFHLTILRVVLAHWLVIDNMKFDIHIEVAYIYRVRMLS